MDLVSNNQRKFEFKDEFPMETKGVFQGPDNILVPTSCFEPDYATHVTGYDPFGPLPYSMDSNDFEFKLLGDVNEYKGVVGWPASDFSRLMESLIQDPKPTSFFVPDEGSCVTANNRIKSYIKKSWKGKKKTNSSKGQWTTEEDRVLKDMVEKYGVRKWSYIAQMLKGRIGKQCRERWHNHLRPDIKKDFWTEEEDRILIAAHAEMGNKWSEIAKKLPGRTENSTKNHWNATKRRQYTKRKCRSKWPRPSPILQNYIKSLNLPRGRMSSSPSNLNLDETFADFDHNEVPEFAMDEKLLEWDNNIDSLLDDIPSISSTINGGVEEMGPYLMASTFASTSSSSEVKKEMDLMEMISHVNI